MTVFDKPDRKGIKDYIDNLGKGIKPNPRSKACRFKKQDDPPWLTVLGVDRTASQLLFSDSILRSVVGSANTGRFNSYESYFQGLVWDIQESQRLDQRRQERIINSTPRHAVEPDISQGNTISERLARQQEALTRQQESYNNVNPLQRLLGWNP